MKTRSAIVLTWISTLLLAACSDSGSGGQQANASGSGNVAGTSSNAGSANSGGSSSGGGGGSGTGAGTGGDSSAAGSMNVAGNAGTSSGGAGGGGGSDTGGSGGGGGANQGPVMPTMQDGKWVLTLGDVTLAVDPQVGARITTFQLGNVNLLTDATVNETYWGSTLWTSPESQWTQPPPGPIDSDPFAAMATDTSVTLTGQPYAMLGVSVTKTFSVDTALGAFHIEYKLTNSKQTAIQMAPWEVTRVFPRGLTFFPTGSTSMLSQGATLPTTDMGGITWFDYDMNAITKDSKLYADGAEGWIAHVADGLVFIKSFGDVTPDKIAPNEGDVELYTNAVHTYIEMEDQAAYGMIAPGASVTWPVNWFLRALPAGVDASVGSAALAQFVRDTIAGK